MLCVIDFYFPSLRRDWSIPCAHCFCMPSIRFFTIFLYLSDSAQYYVFRVILLSSILSEYVYTISAVHFKFLLWKFHCSLMVWFFLRAPSLFLLLFYLIRHVSSPYNTLSFLAYHRSSTSVFPNFVASNSKKYLNIKYNFQLQLLLSVSRSFYLCLSDTDPVTTHIATVSSFNVHLMRCQIILILYVNFKNLFSFSFFLMSCSRLCVLFASVRLIIRKLQ